MPMNITHLFVTVGNGLRITSVQGKGQMSEVGSMNLVPVDLLQPHVPGNKLTQKDNADGGVQLITPTGPRQCPLSKGPRPVFVKTLYTLMYKVP